MLKTTLTLAAVSLALILSSSVSAQSLQYLGPHSADSNDGVDGGQGVLVYNDLCAAAFDGGQMCESIDILRSGSLPFPTPDAIPQWVKPHIVSVLLTSNDRVVYVDASGAQSFPTALVDGAGLSCGGWRVGANPPIGVSGLAMFEDGRFGAFNCDATLAVACCKVTSGKK